MDPSFLNVSSLTNNSQNEICKNSSYLVFWEVLSGICFIVGLLATLIVLKELLNRSRKSVSNKLFMFNLTVCDLIYIVILPLSVMNHMLRKYIPFAYIDDIGDVLSLCARPLLMASSCLDCYFAVVHPIMYRTRNRKWIIRTISSTTVWLITISSYSYKCSDISKIFSYIDSAPLIVALPVITFCDISILKALKTPDPTGKINVHPQKKQALHTVFNSFIMTFVVYLPAAVIFSMRDLISVSEYLYLCVFSVFGITFSMTVCVIMPLLYLKSLGKFGILKNLLKKIWLEVTGFISQYSSM